MGILVLSRWRNIGIQAPHIQNPVCFCRFNIFQTSRSRGQHLCSKFSKIPHLGCPRTLKVSTSSRGPAPSGITLIAALHCNKTQWSFENTREITYIECSQMTGVFYHSVIHSLGFSVCFKIQILHAQNNKTRFFYVLYSDKTWVFDQSERTQGPIYILIYYMALKKPYISIENIYTKILQLIRLIMNKLFFFV